MTIGDVLRCGGTRVETDLLCSHAQPDEKWLVVKNNRALALVRVEDLKVMQGLPMARLGASFSGLEYDPAARARRRDDPIGYHAVAVIADAFLKGIRRMAEALGRAQDSEQSARRAQSFRNIFDPATGFMRAKNADGQFREPFDPAYAQYGSDYTEGNAWQYSWFVPHDVRGLIDLLGGQEAFVRRLDRLFAFEVDPVTFEQVEDITGLIGLYAHGKRAQPWDQRRRAARCAS
jgi:hypothetical protein